MKTKTKVLLILFAVSIAGIAITIGYIIGSGTLMSHEAVKTYEISEPFDSLDLCNIVSGVSIQASDTGGAYVHAYAKAWLSGEINLDDVVRVEVRDGALIVTETPFPDEFLGMFPQPYHLALDIYVPKDVYQKYSGGES